MSKRPVIPAEVKRQLFIEAGHRCAVCGTPFPLERAHIIPWSKSNDHSLENLICLCANCHERADKDWDQATLREYKKNPWVNRQNSSVSISVREITPVKVTIDLELEEFDDSKKRWLQYALASFLQTLPEAVEIKRVDAGSVKVSVNLNKSDAIKLQQAFESHDSTLIKMLLPLHAKDISPDIPAAIDLRMSRLHDIGLRTLRTSRQVIDLYSEELGMASKDSDIAAADVVHAVAEMTAPEFLLLTLRTIHKRKPDIEVMQRLKQFTFAILPAIYSTNVVVDLASDLFLHPDRIAQIPAQTMAAVELEMAAVDGAPADFGSLNGRGPVGNYSMPMLPESGFDYYGDAFLSVFERYLIDKFLVIPYFRDVNSDYLSKLINYELACQREINQRRFYYIIQPGHLADKVISQLLVRYPEIVFLNQDHNHAYVEYEFEVKCLLQKTIENLNPSP